MAAGFLITRLLLVCLLSEVNYSSAFPRARGFVQQRVWQSEGEEEEAYNYENCHPFYYISAQDKTLEKQGRLMTAPFHICKQNHPIVYQKASNLNPANPLQPRSNVATKWPKETVLPQPPAQKKYLSPKPKSYEFNLKIPFLDFLIRNDGKNSPNKKHDGGNDAPAVSKPGFQASSSVSSVSQSLNTPTNSHFVHLASQHKPETPDVLNPEKPISATTESRQPSLNSAETQEQHFPMKPQSSSTLFGSGRPFVSFATPQQETREPVHIKPSLAESTRPLLSFGTTQLQTYKPVRVKPPSSTMTGLEQPFLNFGATQHDGYKPHPIKPQSNSAMIGLRQPFLNSAGTEAQEKPYEPYPIKLQSSSTLTEPARPLRFASPQHRIHEPVGVKPQSSNQIGPERPFVNFGTTQHQSYGPYLVKPQSNSVMIGLRQPFLNSAGTDAQEKLYKPYPIKLQSSSTLVEPARPLRFASPQQNIHEPVGVKPQSSKQIGTERPFVNFGTTQTREQHPVKPQSNSNLIASARPFLSFAAPQPFHIKPQSSTPAESERPYFGTQQQTYEPYPIKPQSSSTIAASAKPFLNFAAPQLQTYEPFHIKPQSSSDRLTSDWPALNYAATGHSQAQQAYEPFYVNSRSTSTRFGSERPGFNSAAARQSYEPVHAKMQSYDSWPYFQDRSTTSSSQMRVQRLDSARNNLNRKSDYPKLVDVAGSDGHDELAYV